MLEIWLITLITQQSFFEIVTYKTFQVLGNEYIRLIWSQNIHHCQIYIQNSFYI